MVVRGRVLVLDGESGGSALAVVRSLAAAGYTVDLGFSAGSPRSPAASRYVAASLAYPDPGHARADFQARLRALAPSYRAVFPVKEAALLAVAEIRAELESAGALVPVPDRETMRIATDKVAMLRRAESLGVPTPRTIITTERPSPHDVGRELGLPFIMKSSTELGLLPVDRHYLVTDPERPTFAREFDLLARHGPVLLQEYVHGYGAGVALLYTRRGALVAHAGHRRIFEEFTDGGPSVIARTDAHPAAFAHARRLLDSFPWSGLALVEFRVNAAREAVYMEVNPRVWGTLPLAIAAGVDFPALLLETFDAEHPPAEAGPSRSRTYVSFEALVTSLTAPREKRQSIARFALALAGSARGLMVRELQGRDPAPAVEELFHVLRARASRDSVSSVDGLDFGPPIDYGRLARRGIRTVIDLREPAEVAARPLEAAGGVDRVAFPLVDDSGVPAAQLAELVALIEERRSRGGVYVHCRQGKGRAPMAAVSLLVARGTEAETAFERVYAARPFTYLNGAQRQAVMDFAASRQPTRRAAPFGTVRDARGVDRPGPVSGGSGSPKREFSPGESALRDVREP